MENIEISLKGAISPENNFFEMYMAILLYSTNHKKIYTIVQLCEIADSEVLQYCSFQAIIYL